MNMATVAGLLGGNVCVPLLDGVSLSTWFDGQSALLVIGGTLAATLVRFPPSTVLSGLPVGIRSLWSRAPRRQELIDAISRTAELLRRNRHPASGHAGRCHNFLATALSYLSDGHGKQFVRAELERETDRFLRRLVDGSRVYRAIGESAPAWGCVGAIFGMADALAAAGPQSALGPVLGAALASILYGVVTAHLLAFPIAHRLSLRHAQEQVARSLVIDGVELILDGKSPSVVRAVLAAYMADFGKDGLAEAP